MTIRNLEFAVRPTSVAVFGASGRAGSVGRVVMDNIVNGGFEGSIWPVNPRHTEVEGRRCYRNTADLPGIPDLGVIVTPPETVPGIIRDLPEENADYLAGLVAAYPIASIEGLSSNWSTPVGRRKRTLTTTGLRR